MRFSWLMLAGALTLSVAAHAQNDIRGEINRAFGTATRLWNSTAALPPGATVSPVPGAAGSFDVTIPELALAAGEGDAILGPVVIRVSPAANGRFAFNARLPESAMLRDARGGPIGKLTARNRSLTGEWDPALETFATLNAQLDGVTLTNFAQGTTTDIAKFMLRHATRTGGNGLHALTLHADADTIRIVSTGPGASETRIAQASFDVAGDKLRLADLRAAQRRMAERARSAGGDANRVVGVDLRPLLNAIGEANGTLSIRTLAMATANGQGDGTLERLDAKFSSPDVGKPRSTIALNVDYDGLAATSPQAPSEVVPRAGKVVATIRNAPLENLIRDALAAQGQPDDLQKRMIRTLQQAGSDVVIETLDLRGPSVTANATGTLKPTTQTKSGVVGDLKIRAEGLEGAAKQLAARDTRRFAGIVIMLNVLAAMADKTGPTYRYDIAFQDSGKVMVNGRDFGPMIAR